MSVLENFKNIPRSPYGGATGLKCNFFLLQICNKVPEEKKRGGLSPPPTGDRPLSPTPGATDQWAQPTGARGAGRPSRGRQGGPVAPPCGRPGQPPYIRPLLSFPPHLTSKNPPKIQKKERGEEKGSGEALPHSALVICRLVHFVYVFFHCIVE